jgi:hypothetical protein
MRSRNACIIILIWCYDRCSSVRDECLTCYTTADASETVLRCRLSFAEQSLRGHLITRVSDHQACAVASSSTSSSGLPLMPHLRRSFRRVPAISRSCDVRSVQRGEAGIGCWQEAVKEMLTYSWHLTVAQHVRGPCQRSARACGSASGEVSGPILKAQRSHRQHSACWV